ncbi:hypothetical protein B1H38_17750 [Leptospira borgpetersenii serovar Ballum]|nr:hypothetical protein B1H38_17750 [Leptospira borgpetersenii serovar Ballum]
MNVRAPTFCHYSNYIKGSLIFCTETGLLILGIKLTVLRQNGAPSGLEKRGLDASIYHKTRKPTEGTQ